MSVSAAVPTHGIRSCNLNFQINQSWTDNYLDELVGYRFGNRYDTQMDTYTGGKIGSASGQLSGSMQLMNYWSVYAGLWQSLKNGEDVFRASDYDFIYRYPKGRGYWAGIANDYSSPFNVSLNSNVSNYRDGDSWSGSIRFRVRPRPNLEFNFEPRLQRNSGFSDFSDPLALDTGFPAPEKILTLRDTRFESYVFRSSYTMNNRLDFRLFAQYTDYSSNRHTPLEPGPWDISDPLALRSTLGIHFVTRFEFRPGSFFYLVYKESRYDEHDDVGFSRPDRQIIGKFTYWLSKG